MCILIAMLYISIISVLLQKGWPAFTKLDKLSQKFCEYGPFLAIVFPMTVSAFT